MNFQLLQGDSLRLLRELPDASVGMVLTDPPFSSGGQFRGDRVIQTGSKYGAAALADFAGDNRDQRSFLLWSTLWLAECHRVAVPGSICAVFIDWRQLPTMTDALQAGGWVWRGVSAWHKPNARPQLGRPWQDCEFICWGTAGPRVIVGETGPKLMSVCPPTTHRVHQTEKPVTLLREWVKLCPAGDLVLDPFAGSGAVGLAALLEGRRFLGMEISQHFATLASERLAGVESGTGEDASQLGLWGQP